MVQNNMYKDIIKPTLVLIVIVAVMSALLAITYNVAGIGELGKGIPPDELDAMMPTVLPSATKLKNTNMTFDSPDILGVYEDETNAGSAIHLETNGYGGPMKMLVGVDKDGKVAGIKIIESAETPNLGTKAHETGYLAQYIGKSGILAITKDGGDIDMVAGASTSSRAVATGVTRALEIYESVKGDL